MEFLIDDDMIKAAFSTHTADNQTISFDDVFSTFQMFLSLGYTVENDFKTVMNQFVQTDGNNNMSLEQMKALFHRIYVITGSEDIFETEFLIEEAFIAIDPDGDGSIPMNDMNAIKEQIREKCGAITGELVKEYDVDMDEIEAAISGITDLKHGLGANSTDHVEYKLLIRSVINSLKKLLNISIHSE